MLRKDKQPKYKATQCRAKVSGQAEEARYVAQTDAHPTRCLTTQHFIFLDGHYDDGGDDDVAPHTPHNLCPTTQYFIFAADIHQTDSLFNVT